MTGSHRFYVPAGIVPLSAAPGSPGVGDTYFDTSVGVLRTWDGVEWSTPSKVGHTHPAPPHLNEVWLWSDATSGDPGSGYMLTDTTTFDTTSLVSVSKLTADGEDSTVWWGSVAVGDSILIIDQDRTGTLDAIVNAAVVDNGTWVDIPVRPLDDSTNSNPKAGDNVMVTWLPPSSPPSYSQAESNLRFVNADGDTMRGQLLQPLIPLDPAALVNKAYADQFHETAIAPGPTGPVEASLELWVDTGDDPPVLEAYSRAEADAKFVDAGGDALGGPLYLPAIDPVDPTEATTKAYVDTRIALGRYAHADSSGSTAIGVDSSGTGATATADNQIVLGTTNHTVSIPGALEVGGVPVLERLTAALDRIEALEARIAELEQMR